MDIEVNYRNKRRYNTAKYPMENDSFYCYPTKENVVTKLALATEEIYAIHMQEINSAKEKSVVS